jgi:hypothetical protein
VRRRRCCWSQPDVPPLREPGPARSPARGARRGGRRTHALPLRAHRLAAWPQPQGRSNRMDGLSASNHRRSGTLRIMTVRDHVRYGATMLIHLSFSADPRPRM